MIPVCCICGKAASSWHSIQWEGAGGLQDFCAEHATQLQQQHGPLVEYSIYFNPRESEQVEAAQLLHLHPKPTNMQKPTIGRIVIYHTTHEERKQMLTEPKQCPAIITYVHSDNCVNLHVFADAERTIYKRSIQNMPPNEAGETPGNSWSWPVIAPVAPTTVDKSV